MMTLLGAFYPAIDLAAGEKERGTLETLLTAPVPAHEIVAGKFAAVTLIGMAAAAANLVSMLLTFQSGLFRFGPVLENAPRRTEQALIVGGEHMPDRLWIAARTESGKLPISEDGKVAFGPNRHFATFSTPRMPG
jgi:hypothetical protein